MLGVIAYNTSQRRSTMTRLFDRLVKLLPVLTLFRRAGRVVTLSLLLSSLLVAGQITITGQYVDKKNNPIVGASVEYFANIAQLDSTSTDENGNFMLTINTVGIETEALPDRFYLGQNYPNPFNPETHITVETPYPATMTIFNIRGQFVDKIKIPVGSNDIIWGGLDRYSKPVAAGIYILYFEADDFHSSKRITLLDGGNGSRLRIAHTQTALKSTELAKASTVDEIHFIKPNTTIKVIQLTTITQDTSLGIITGNVGPTILQTIPYDSCGQVEYMTWDLDQLIYNDGDSRYSLKDTAEFEFHPHYPNILEFLAYPMGTFSTTLFIEDITDPFLNDSMQLKYKTFYVAPPWTLPIQIADISDISIAEDDTLFLNMQHYVEDNDLDIDGYWIDSLPNATYYTSRDSLWIIPEPDFYGSIDSIIIRVMDGYYPDSVYLNPFNLTINPINDAPQIMINPIMTNVDEDHQGEVIIADFSITDIENDPYTYEFYNSMSDSVFLRIDGSTIILDSLAANYNGTISYGISASDGDLESNKTDELTINAIPDVTLNIRTLNYAGTPIMDDIVSTFQIGDSSYQATGSITKQLIPGISYEIFAFNDSIGFFDTTGTKTYESHIAIRTPGGNPLVTPALETRAWGDQSSALIFNGNDAILDLYVFGMNVPNYKIMNDIINNWMPAGIDKPNTATPECYIDTSSTGYSKPSPETVANAQHIIQDLLPEVSEGRYTPIWMGFGDPPNSNPDGETVLTTS